MSTIIYGRNPIESAVKAKRVKELYTLQHLAKDRLVMLAISMAVPVKFVSENSLSGMASTPSHQGFVAISEDYGTVSLDDLLSSLSKPYPLIVLLDSLEDPQNLGAILRTCDAFGVDGVVMKNRGQVPLNGTVAKVSTGAINYVKVSTVANLSQAIEKLKDKGFWIVASDGSGILSYKDVDYRCPIGLVVGSEGFGIQPLVLKRSDFVVKIPMCGHVNSLNASVAAAILISNIVASRL